jgi:hypothetical protein
LYTMLSTTEPSVPSHHGLVWKIIPQHLSGSVLQRY